MTNLIIASPHISDYTPKKIIKYSARKLRATRASTREGHGWACGFGRLERESINSSAIITRPSDLISLFACHSSRSIRPASRLPFVIRHLIKRQFYARRGEGSAAAPERNFYFSLSGSFISRAPN
jgi:hypothetical protein